MANALDVAKYILRNQGPMTAMKLQKLVYYAQAWSLVWDEKPLFQNRIEAWANGPVIPALYKEHRGRFRVSSDSIEGDGRKLTSEERETVDRVLEYYGNRSSQWLSDLTHSEKPWRDCRKGLKPGDRGERVITPAAMAEYYESL